MYVVYSELYNGYVEYYQIASAYSLSKNKDSGKFAMLTWCCKRAEDAIKFSSKEEADAFCKLRNVQGIVEKL